MTTNTERGGDIILDLVRNTAMQQRRLIKISAVQDKVGQKTTWIYAQMSKGKFPKQVSIGPGAVAWVESEIDAWISDRIDERDLGQDCRHPR